MPDISRRNLLKFLGLTPAIPLLTKIPPTVDITDSVTHNLTAVSPVGITGGAWSGGPGTYGHVVAAGGFCAPIAPLYDHPWPEESRPVRDLLPTVRTPRHD